MAFNPDKCLKFMALADGCTIGLDTSPLDYSHYKFSKDGSTWVDDTITLDPGETCYVKGTNFTGGFSICRSFSFSGPVKIVSGNLMSLLDDGAGERTSMGGNYAFMYLFKNCTNLQSIPSGLLPATGLGYQCYAYTFMGCSGLTSLPADLLPATVLGYECYQGMFYKCTGLTSLPAGLLPATSLARQCYKNMFMGCSNLTSVPRGLLPAETLGASCYANMFEGCSSLKEIYVPFTQWNPTNATTQWVKGVSANGVFHCPETLPQTFGVNNIPTGWTVNPPKKEPEFNSITFQGNLKAPWNKWVASK